MSDSIPKRRPTACTTRLHVVRVSETDVVLVEHRIVLDALRLNAVGAQAPHERLERASIPHAEREVVDPDPALTEPIVARRPLERATGRMLVGGEEVQVERGDLVSGPANDSHAINEHRPRHARVRLGRDAGVQARRAL
jgi:hypothetical protein